MPHAVPSMRTERYETIIVGGGQAGLATGYELLQRDIDVLILDDGSQVGDSWRRRWDSLRLLTSARRNGLPGMPFPASPGHKPDKDEVAAYLEAYAARFDLPVRLATAARSLRRVAGRYEILTDELRYEATHVVVATGSCHTPRIPMLAGEFAPHILQLHSSGYINPLLLSGGDTLVVGAGNSGVQIAMELAGSRQVWLAGRPVRGRLIPGLADISSGWPWLSRLTSPFTDRAHAPGGDPLVGITMRDVIASGVISVGRMTNVERGLPVCGGAQLPVDTVIWATGFKQDFSWIDLPSLDHDDLPRSRRGVVEVKPGLFFVGLRHMQTYHATQLGGVGRAAALVADQIAGPASLHRSRRTPFRRNQFANTQRRSET